MEEVESWYYGGFAEGAQKVAKGIKDGIVGVGQVTAGVTEGAARTVAGVTKAVVPAAAETAGHVVKGAAEVGGHVLKGAGTLAAAGAGAAAGAVAGGVGATFTSMQKAYHDRQEALRPERCMSATDTFVKKPTQANANRMDEKCVRLKPEESTDQCNLLLDAAEDIKKSPARKGFIYGTYKSPGKIMEDTVTYKMCKRRASTPSDAAMAAREWYMRTAEAQLPRPNTLTPS